MLPIPMYCVEIDRLRRRGRELVVYRMCICVCEIERERENE